MPTIHPQAHDIPMDYIVTENGIAQVADGRLVAMDDLARVRASAAQLLGSRAAS